jgi:hypothetical protein
VWCRDTWNRPRFKQRGLSRSLALLHSHRTSIRWRAKQGEEASPDRARPQSKGLKSAGNEERKYNLVRCVRKERAGRIISDDRVERSGRKLKDGCCNKRNIEGI